MSRSGVQVRAVRLDDADEVMVLWESLAGRNVAADVALAEVQSTIRKVLASDRERIMIAELNGRVVGGLHLRVGELAPMTSQQAVFTSHLTVVPEFRRRGIARSLMESAVTWAEENAIGHVVALTAVNARDTSRFMARLGLSQIAVARAAPTSLLRAKLPVERPGAMRPLPGGRQLGQVLAARRSLRRSQNVG